MSKRAAAEANLKAKEKVNNEETSIMGSNRMVWALFSFGIFTVLATKNRKQQFPVFLCGGSGIRSGVVIF